MILLRRTDREAVDEYGGAWRLNPSGRWVPALALTPITRDELYELRVARLVRNSQALSADDVLDLIQN